MARPLSANINAVQTFRDKRPTAKVEIIDVKSGNVTITDVIQENFLGTDIRDFSAEIVSITYREAVSDYTSVGIAAPEVTFTIDDETGQFDPFNTIASPTGNGRFLRRGNVLRLTIGGERVDSSEHVLVFTGLLVGQAGVKRSRSTGIGPVSQITCKAVGREAGFLKAPATSNEFSLGTGYGTMATDVAQNEMSLDASEINFPTFTGRTTGHRVTQFVEEPPLGAIAKITWVDGFLPFFDGEGILTARLFTVNQSPSRIYDADEDGSLFNLVETPFSEINPINRVTVLGLSADMTKVTQPQQVLVKADLSLGFFADDEELDVFFSEDRTQLGENLSMNIVRSMNASIFGIVLGGDEDFTAIQAPGPNEGSIGATIEIDTGFAPQVVGLLAVTYLAAAFIPDLTIGFGAGETIPIGRFIQAGILVTILTIMQRQGRGTYEILGNPFEYVFLEVKGIAEIAGLLSSETNDVVIENHLVQDQSTADARAGDVLLLEQAKGNPRSVDMHFDLRLQAGDVYTRADGRSYYIAEQTVTFSRGARAIKALQTVYETTGGIYVDGDQA